MSQAFRLKLNGVYGMGVVDVFIDHRLSLNIFSCRHDGGKSIIIFLSRKLKIIVLD